MKICGIYSWTNTINGKKYIGESKNIDTRWIKHEQNAKLGIRSKFYNALRKYGSNIFVKEILELCDKDSDKMYMLEREKFYMLKFDSVKNGYNSSILYDTISNNINKVEIYKKISKNKKELNKSWIYKDNKSKCVNADILNNYLKDGWNLGRKFSQIHKQNISKALKKLWNEGYMPSEESRAKMSTFKDKNHTEKTLKKMRKACKNQYTLKWFVKRYGKLDGFLKYNDKCKKLKNRKMANGIDWFISRYGIEEGIKKYQLKQEKLSKRKKTFINNSNVCKLISLNELESYINNGWTKGMLKAC